MVNRIARGPRSRSGSQTFYACARRPVRRVAIPPCPCKMVERPPGSRALVGISAFGGLENGPQSSSHPVASTCNIAPFPCRRIVNLKNWLKAVRKKGTMSHETAIFQQVNADKVAAHHTAVSCLVRSVRASPWLPVRGVAGGRRRARPWCRDAGR